MTSKQTSKKSIREYIDKLEQQDDDIYTIEFEQPDKKIKGETRSKFISPDSELFFFISDAQYKLKHSGIRFEVRLPPHVEILTQKEFSSPSEKTTFLNRVSFLEGKNVNVFSPDNYKMIQNKKFVMLLPKNKELGLEEPYITIAHVNFLSNKERFLKIILNKEYDTESVWEQTIFD